MITLAFLTAHSTQMPSPWEETEKSFYFIRQAPDKQETASTVLSLADTVGVKAVFSNQCVTLGRFQVRLDHLLD